MKLLDKYNISKLAYEECKKGNNTKQMRNLITDSTWAWYYCLHIENDNEVKSRLYPHDRERIDEIWRERDYLKKL